MPSLENALLLLFGERKESTGNPGLDKAIEETNAAIKDAFAPRLSASPKP